ncbi:MAG: hypothetical protein HKP27_16355 [Myxococcales bacterium]|nr:hypothetical protein [Myxococcales bacterium]
MTDYAELSPEDLLERIGTSLRKEIGPAVTEAYPKTQAFLAAVVLQKLSGQLRNRDRDRAANRKDLEALFTELDRALENTSTPTPLADALAEARSLGDRAALSGIVEALYATRDELGETSFQKYLGRVRATLRARLDRELAYSA